MHKHSFFCLWLAFTIAISGCSLRNPESGTVPSSIADYSEAAPGMQNAPTERRFSPSSPYPINRTETVNGQTTSIHATVEPFDISGLRSVTMEADPGGYSQMFQYFCQTLYPDAEGATVSYEDGQYDLRIDGEWTLDVGDMTSGRVYMVDLKRNLNGCEDLGESSAWLIPHYITAITPLNMLLTPSEAAQRVLDILKPYSDFDFIPWNITAENDTAAGKGYYKIKLQQTYNGIPVYDANSILIVNAAYSEEGLFSLQGSVLLREKISWPVEVSFGVEEAVERFFQLAPAFSHGESLECKEITVGYIVANASSGLTLTPAWIFLYEIHTTGEDAFTYYYTCGFSMEDGSLKLNQIF